MFKRLIMMLTIALIGVGLLSACGPNVPELTPIPTLAPRPTEPGLDEALQQPADVEAPALAEGDEAAEEAAAEEPETIAAVSLDEALTVYEANCQACHGVEGLEGTVGPSLAENEEVAALSDQELHTILLNGIEGTAMTAYQGILSDSEMWGLVALIRSWNGQDYEHLMQAEAEAEEAADEPEAEPEAEAETEEAADEPEAEAEAEEAAEGVTAVPLEDAIVVYESNCQSCHGVEGQSAAVGPDLADNEEVADLDDQTILDILMNGIEGTAMVSYEEVITEPEMLGLVALIRDWNGQDYAYLIESGIGGAEEEATEPEQAEEAEAEAEETEEEVAADFDEELALAAYTQHCQMCHGDNGMDATIGPDLADNPEVGDMSAADLEDILLNGVEGTAMQSFADRLSDEETGALIGLMHSWNQ